MVLHLTLMVRQFTLFLFCFAFRDTSSVCALFFYISFGRIVSVNLLISHMLAFFVSSATYGTHYYFLPTITLATHNPCLTHCCYKNPPPLNVTSTGDQISCNAIPFYPFWPSKMVSCCFDRGLLTVDRGMMRRPRLARHARDRQKNSRITHYCTRRGSSIRSRSTKRHADQCQYTPKLSLVNVVVHVDELCVQRELRVA